MAQAIHVTWGMLAGIARRIKTLSDLSTVHRSRRKTLVSRNRPACMALRLALPTTSWFQ